MSTLFWNRGFDVWSELDRMRDEMDAMFRSSGRRRRRPVGVFPAVNIATNESNVVLRFEMPGVPQEAINLTVTRDTLALSGERVAGVEPNEEVSFHRRERLTGRFNRSVHLPYEVDPEMAKAEYSNGILTVTLEREAKSRPRTIVVQ